jgi:AcrR family transcriptional regulator
VPATRKSRTAYHHGALREALLEASLDVIASAGVEGLSLREVARRAGVTHGAPYHHFPDKEALLAALATDGFRLLQGRLAKARHAAGPDAGAQLEAMFLAYLAFARRHRTHFRVMFKRDLTTAEALATAQQAGEGTFELVIEVTQRCQEQGLAPRGDPLPIAMAVWSSAHGLASLGLDGALGSIPDKGSQGLVDAKRLTQQVAALVRSLLASAA